jgi:hypothetical protein
MMLWLFERTYIIEIGDSRVSKFAAADLESKWCKCGDVRIYFKDFGHRTFVQKLRYEPSEKKLSRSFRALALREQRAPFSDVDYIKHCTSL